MKEIELRELAKVFVKHNYFSEDKENYEIYSVLLDVYDTLTQDSKDKLLDFYKIMQKG